MRRRHWTDEQLDVAEAFATQAALKLDNARLYEDARRAYEELSEAQDRVIQQEKMALLGTFASGLAHEVRNPLNSIGLQLTVLERRHARLETALGRELGELTLIIREEVRRLDRLVGDFLLFARSGRLLEGSGDLDAVAADVVALLAPEADDVHVTLHWRRVGEAARRLRLDAEKMKQVVINLVRNAIEAQPDGGEVVVETGVLDGRARLVVHDSGPGLPEGVDVFQLFVTTKAKGTGLGLSIVQQIVRHHGGEIRTSRGPLGGASFAIDLPGRAHDGTGRSPVKDKGRVVVIDDEVNAVAALETLLREDGYEVAGAHDARAGLALLERLDADIVLTDLRMPGMDGLELLAKVKEMRPDTMVIVMTAYGTVKTAVKAMKMGAEDYLGKPIDVEEVEVVLQRALEKKRLVEETRVLRDRVQTKYRFENLVGESPDMLAAFKTIQQVAPSSSSLLLLGESGTGKELFAQALHQNSPRRSKPFVKVACAALPETLLESELFGHEKGSFTGAAYTRAGRFELADGGTLFLDEIGDISPTVQVKLLRFLEEREFERVGGNRTFKVDVRIVAATHRDLQKKLAEGTFREDLYYRLNVIELHIPALRERPGGHPGAGRALPEALRRAERQGDPGLLRRGAGAPAAPSRGPATSASWRTRWSARSCSRTSRCWGRRTSRPSGGWRRRRRWTPRASARASRSQGARMAELEREAILRTLEAVGGSTSRAAELLQISARKIQYKLKEYHQEDAIKRP